MADPIAAIGSIAQIKERVSIVDLVARAGLTVEGQGCRRRTKEHPSLTLYTDENTWWWFSQGAGGDVFDWWMRDQRCDFRRVLDDLAHLAGVELKPRTPADEEAANDERRRAKVLQLASTVYHGVLMSHPAARSARDWCHKRGWTDETLIAHRIGYVLPSTAAAAAASAQDAMPALSAVLHDAKFLEHPMAKAVLSLPGDMIVYPHLVGGQCVYLSGRGVSTKRHYNLPAELAGPKRLFVAEPVDEGDRGSPLRDGRARQEGVKKASGVTVLVEGQADALSLAQWGFRAVALCGVSFGSAGGSAQDAALHQADARALQGISHVALDNDTAGRMKALDVAWRIDPLRRVAVWPGSYRNERTEASVPVKDANDMLAAGATAEEVGAILDAAQPALLARADLAKRAHREERWQHLEAIGTAWRNLDPLDEADLCVEISRELGVGLGQFRRLMTAAEKRAEAAAQAAGGGAGDGAAAGAAGEMTSPEVYENSAGGAAGGAAAAPALCGSSACGGTMRGCPRVCSRCGRRTGRSRRRAWWTWAGRRSSPTRRRST